MSESTPTESKVSAVREPTDVVCPFCAMLCDDVSLAMRNGEPDATPLDCPKARQGFTSALAHPSASPLLRGAPCSLDTAVAHARELLSGAAMPLFYGLHGDLADANAAWRLAASFGGVVDHRDSDGLARNLAALQDSGTFTTSLGEVRNRADLLVVVGADLNALYPRFVERVVNAKHRLHASGPIALVELGDDALATLNATRILLRGRSYPDAPAAEALADQLRDCSYPVFVVAGLEGPWAEMILRATSELVRDINETRRAAMLLMAAGIGDVTTQLSGGWHCGFGVRTTFASGYPQHDLHRFSAQRLLQRGDADLMVWFSSLSIEQPPDTTASQIVIGHPGMQFKGQPPEVFLPVAVPGVHRAGYLHRGDGLRMLPLRAITDSSLPDTQTLCERLLPDSTVEN